MEQLISKVEVTNLLFIIMMFGIFIGMVLGYFIWGGRDNRKFLDYCGKKSFCYLDRERCFNDSKTDCLECKTFMAYLFNKEKNKRRDV